MRQRFQATGLVLLILIVGIGLIVAVTEYHAGANAAGPRLLATSDVVDALTEAGLEVVPERDRAYHPLLEVSGTTLRTESGQIEVYIYPSVAGRVADEQVIQQRLLQMQAFATEGEPFTRVTSARNVLLLLDIGSDRERSQAYSAAAQLASNGGR